MLINEARNVAMGNGKGKGKGKGREQTIRRMGIYISPFLPQYVRSVVNLTKPGKSITFTLQLDKVVDKFGQFARVARHGALI